ncbi:MAG: aspartate kinase [Staphylothermus sp.]|nr:aspartate kinase [Staphylothermus sp.]
MYAVVKIGGSLLKSIDSYIHNALKIMEVFIEKNVYPLIIVSAPKGLTNILYDTVNNDPSKIRQVEERVYDLISEVDNEAFRRKIESILLKAKSILNNKKGIDHVLKPAVISIGERISRVLMEYVLDYIGIETIGLDARDYIVTDNNYLDARIDLKRTKHRINWVKKLLRDGTVLVMEGFIGSSIEGYTTLLGRGGSDYTAVAVASVLGINDVYLVTDVDGIMSIDPRIDHKAVIVRELSYDEAIVAAEHRVKGFNKKSFYPLIEYYNNIVVHVGSWTKFGTIIKKKVKTLGKPKVLGVRQSASYMALIGGCSSSSLIVKKVLDVLLEEGISIHEIQAYSEKPLSILKVSHEELVSASRIIHREIVLGEQSV